MYLSDRDIRDLLPKLGFETGDIGDPFRAAEQIQPCSVDLRLDHTFWRQKRGQRIDLRSAKLFELQPRLYWERVTLDEGHGIVLKPGQMLLGRTFESFTIPAGYAGKLEGRSSFARMGLGIHCSADFINPGYGGRMPLQLINYGKSAITLFPRIPICQLMIIPLSSPSDRVYGDRELYSKYMNDDGGPSYWWRDKRIKELHESLGQKNIPVEVQENLLRAVALTEPDVLVRLDAFIRQQPMSSLSNVDDTLADFAKSLRTKPLFEIFHG